MLFNSYVFIFIFLPIVLLGFHHFGKRGHHRIALTWLVGASLFFYGWWNPAYLGLIVASVIFNYGVGVSLCKKPSKLTLVFGITINLGIIGIFKYANFFIDNFNITLKTSIHLNQIILPLAISFFTFQQIIYLVDSYRGLIKEYNFLSYCLFVTFFPQLIAGPIVYHKEMLPQFKNKALCMIKSSNLSVGITLFILGLFKKVVFADNIEVYATPVFDAAENGIILTIFEAWGGVLAYTFQIYFDFSGYSDMAIGIARMFGVVLPINFYSPYKANSIIEFWRRWHMSLSRFLRDYVYFPLGGNRKGKCKRYGNIMITMLLGGLWHGAGWTFIFWGGLHGLYLSINHGWRALNKKNNNKEDKNKLFKIILSRLFTFISVVVGWVMFRAESLDGAINMYSAMFGGYGISIPGAVELKLVDLSDPLAFLGASYDGMSKNSVLGNNKEVTLILIIMLLFVWFAPNSLDCLRKDKPVYSIPNYLLKYRSELVTWKYNAVFGFTLAAITYICILSMAESSEFIYFQF